MKELGPLTTVTLAVEKRPGAPAAPGGPAGPAGPAGPGSPFTDPEKSSGVSDLFLMSLPVTDESFEWFCRGLEAAPRRAPLSRIDRDGGLLEVASTPSARPFTERVKSGGNYGRE